MMKPPRDATPLGADTTRALDLVVPPRTPQRYAPGYKPAPRGRELRARADLADLKNPPPSAKETPDQGEVLARAARPDGTELRVSVHEFNGAKFIRVALWQPNGWPVKGKAVAVRMGEVPTVARGIADVLDRVNGDV